MRITVCMLLGTSCLALLCTAPRPATACSPAPPGDWSQYYFWIADEEADVGTNILPVALLGRNEGHTGYGDIGTLDASDLHFVCDGSELAGVWDIDSAVMRFDGLWWNDADGWSDSNGCGWCEGNYVISNLQFIPDHPLPPGAQCEAVLDVVCRTMYGSACNLPFYDHEYPWTFMRFTTGSGPVETAPPAPAPDSAPIRYQYRYSTCGNDGISTCSVCILQWEEQRFGVEVTLPAPVLPGWQRYHLTVAPTVEQLINGDVLTHTVDGDTAQSPLRLAFPLGALSDSQTSCVQLQVEDRYGNLSAPSAPVCMSPQSLPALRRGCSCHAAPSASAALLLVWLLLLGVRAIRRARSAPPRR